IKPGTKVGAPAVVTITPATPVLTISSRASTSPKGTPQDLTVYRELATDVLEITGSIPLGDSGYSGRIATSRPAMLFSYLLRSALAERGITVSGKTRTVNSRSGGTLVARNPANPVALPA